MAAEVEKKAIAPFRFPWTHIRRLDVIERLAGCLKDSALRDPREVREKARVIYLLSHHSHHHLEGHQSEIEAALGLSLEHIWACKDLSPSAAALEQQGPESTRRRKESTMATEFSKAFDVWMDLEGAELIPQALAPLTHSDRTDVAGLMRTAWMAGGRAASQQQLDRMKAQETES